jgi:hypothetical protein
MESAHRYPAITVIIVNRNTADLLLACLQHVYASDLEATPQVIVVDNGSTDDSVIRVQTQFPDVLVLEAGRNLGFAAANNWALEHARCDFVLLVNTDAMLEPACARRLAQLMESDPSIGTAGPQLLNEDGSPQTSYEAVPTLATETLNRSLLKRLFPRRFPGKNRPVAEPTEVEALIGAVMIIRTRALQDLNGFDQGYFFFLEETDLAVRMRQNGWKVFHTPHAWACHLQGATAKTYESAARIEFYRSRYRFFAKHYPPLSGAILKTAMTANLTLNTLVLGLANIITLSRIPQINGKYRVRKDLLLWHLKGRPEHDGLPRT